MASWGMIGLGEMGLPMALNIVRAGLPLTVFDVRREAVEDAARAGARIAETPAALAAEAEVVGIVVRDREQAAAVLEGKDGLLSSPRHEATIVLHSTIGPSACRKLEARAVEGGFRFLDAPISGMRMRAEAGTLTFLIGGDEADLKRARSGLRAMGERIFHLGPVGAGQAAKLANNLVSLSTVMVVAEALALGQAEGIDEATLLQVLGASSGDSWIARNWDFLRHRWRREHPLGGAGVGEMVGKDLRLALELAHEAGLPVPSAALACQLVPRLVADDRPLFH